MNFISKVGIGTFFGENISPPPGTFFEIVVISDASHKNVGDFVSGAELCKSCVYKTKYSLIENM